MYSVHVDALLLQGICYATMHIESKALHEDDFIHTTYTIHSLHSS